MKLRMRLHWLERLGLKIEYANKIKLRQLDKNFKKFNIRHSAKGLIFFSLQPSALAECENAASVIHYCEIQYWIDFIVGVVSIQLLFQLYLAEM